MSRSDFPSEKIESVKALIRLLTPPAENADETIRAFEEELASVDPEDFSNLLWVLKDVTDWESTYFVDWKDTESFVGCVSDIARAWQASLSFGVSNPMDEEFLEETDVPELMTRVYDELLPQGLTLWNWGTQSDCYSGWITKSASAEKIRQIANTLEVAIRPGSHPF